MKYKRHNRIIEIIKDYEIETQDALIDKLRDSGFDVTQATVSRDIRELKLVKVMSPEGRLKYAVTQPEDPKNTVKYNNIMLETVHSIDYAQNLAVLKTHSGMAQAAAAAVDAMKYPKIVGCIAGDDTILVVFKT
nr:arginine repressor [Clostridia bacterium]